MSGCPHFQIMALYLHESGQSLDGSIQVNLASKIASIFLYSNFQHIYLITRKSSQLVFKTIEIRFVCNFFPSNNIFLKKRSISLRLSSLSFLNSDLHHALVCVGIMLQLITSGKTFFSWILPIKSNAAIITTFCIFLLYSLLKIQLLLFYGAVRFPALKPSQDQIAPFLWCCQGWSLW